MMEIAKIFRKNKKQLKTKLKQNCCQHDSPEKFIPPELRGRRELISSGNWSPRYKLISPSLVRGAQINPWRSIFLADQFPAPSNLPLRCVGFGALDSFQVVLLFCYVHNFMCAILNNIRKMFCWCCFCQSKAGKKIKINKIKINTPYSYFILSTVPRAGFLPIRLRTVSGTSAAHSAIFGSFQIGGNFNMAGKDLSLTFSRYFP